MRRNLFILTLTLLNACSNNTPEKTTTPINVVVEKPNFFPVTAYLKGQIYDIKEKGLTPIRYITGNNHSDSATIKFDDLNELCKEFLHPQIDSANLVPFFTESKFLDQTINAFTFTYDAKANIPDSIPLIHWDVYVEPETGKVKRVYIIKNSSNKTLQLTWQSNQWCKTTTVVNLPNGTSIVEKEEKISWDY